MPRDASPAAYYDSYWTGGDAPRRAARSRARAALALDLLGPERGRLLEAGCGPGDALAAFESAGFVASGVDVSPVAVERARARGLDVQILDIARDGAEPAGAPFDAVVALEVLEHVLDPLALLERLSRWRGGAGRLVVSLPNELTWPRRLAALTGRLSFGGHDDPHVRHFDLAAHRRLFDAARLRVAAACYDGCAPPRWGLLKRATDPLARLFPGGLAISAIYLLETFRR